MYFHVITEHNDESYISYIASVTGAEELESFHNCALKIFNRAKVASSLSSLVDNVVLVFKCLIALRFPNLIAYMCRLQSSKGIIYNCYVSFFRANAATVTGTVAAFDCTYCIQLLYNRL